jgi:hypothetical protein
MKTQVSLPGLGQPFVVGSMATPTGKVPKVASTLLWADRWGTIKARWAIGRMHYTIEPGLYALGNPDHGAPVLVTANYKMSFDRLREALPGRNLWILVLDTKGINVWCAAGKGTFGTEELVSRIQTSGLGSVVSHRLLVLPQLSGPGVAAHQVKKLSGFKVVYGPIRARDLGAFLDGQMKATPDMRRQTFTFMERAVLIPVELVSALKAVLYVAPVLFFLGGLAGPNGFWVDGVSRGGAAVLSLLSAVFAGAVLTPLLLPWLPGRAFSLKGLSTGFFVFILFTALHGSFPSSWSGRLELFGFLLLIPAATAYLAMNFTGCSTYTSLSGVKKETRLALPMEISAAILGLVLWFFSSFAV